MDRSKLHPLIVLTVDALAREFGVPPKELWDALEGKPSRREFVERLVAAYYPGLRESDFVIEGSLTARKEPSTIRTMRANEIDEPRVGRPIGEKVDRSPAGNKLVAVLIKRGISIAEVARAVKRDAATMRAYLRAKDSKHYRPMPDDVKAYIRSEYGVSF